MTRVAERCFNQVSGLDDPSSSSDNELIINNRIDVRALDCCGWRREWS